MEDADGFHDGILGLSEDSLHMRPVAHASRHGLLRQL